MQANSLRRNQAASRFKFGCCKLNTQSHDTPPTP
jgi:hypothetical protein